YRIAHNESVSLLRRRDQRRDVPEVGAEIVASAEEQVIDRERFAALIADLNELPERPRGALLMRELSGLSHEEIALALSTSVAAGLLARVIGGSAEHGAASIAGAAANAGAGAAANTGAGVTANAGAGAAANAGGSLGMGAGASAPAVTAVATKALCVPLIG